MPAIKFTFTYLHPYEKLEESTSIVGECDFKSTLLAQLKETASKLQIAFDNQQLTAMKIGNNFLITNAQNGNEYIPVSLNRLLVNSEHATKTMNKIDTLITRINQAEQPTINSNRFFRPIERSEHYSASTSTPPLQG